MQLTQKQIEELNSLTEGLTHSEIADLREEMRDNGDQRYLARNFWYDYDQQCWIEPDRIKAI